ncbi:pilus assembly protein [Proteiniclasticum sp. SCR006]|uniref:Pilus assembly protein n=1 Tax=Proteiniclasticum aestuarii TaxID=2817862 RepID=A0A939HDJ6_9CLOT|nr:TadE/TadG family type IV pilus assembly protein [Proteiniclasticum aestuarii]MBO1265976.1 pilus assembly protein [Proteiniclasticum aestuarii]
MYKKLEIHKKEEGQGLVEFALVLPILLLFLLGIIEFGWLFNARISLTSAAREGARVAAVSNINHQAKAEEAVTSSLSGASGVVVTSVGYDSDIDTLNNIRNVIIEVNGQVEPLIGFFVTGPQQMTAKATMRLE